jgi:peroxiredoxin
LAAARPELESRNARLLIVGPGNQRDAEKLAKAVGASQDQVLWDEAGEVYDAYMLDRVLFNLIQKSATFLIDTSGVVQSAFVLSNPILWYSRLPEFLKSLDSLRA